ncbi:hypothetical protein HYN49_13440 [Flavobacterium pallidum]|uniref:Uncharacterized protein n=1 Tax=Flavobacterium pallidum TaxID=2172098 RepID=A0A2S1SK68_9FLAO|nr:hypothetical protein HYN49_13440 [Flavobacterium pallidum]
MHKANIRIIFKRIFVADMAGRNCLVVTPKSQLTSGGFTSVAAFEAEYSRLDRTKLWKKVVHFTWEAAIA